MEGNNIVDSPIFGKHTITKGRFTTLSEWARAVFPKRLQPEWVLVLQHRGYSDRSAVPATGAVAVAGWILSVPRWDRFEGHWRAALHMRDLEGGQGEFKGWPRFKRETLKRRLAGVLRQAKAKGVSVALLQHDLDSVLTEAQQREVSAYGLCGANAIGGAMRWCPGPIVCIFERGDVGAHKITQGVDKACRQSARFNKRLWHFGFQPKGWWGLEAADFLAYEATRHLPQKAGGGGDSPRDSLQELLRGIEHRSVHLDREVIRRMVFADGVLTDENV